MGNNRTLQSITDGPSIRPQTLFVRDIMGLHPQIIELNNILPLNPYPSFDNGQFSKELILALLQLRPIIVKPVNGKFVCAGNEQSFMVAKIHLDPFDKVPVSLIPNRSTKEIDKLYATEHLYLPIFSGCGSDKQKVLISLWKSLKSDQSPWSANPTPAINTQSKFIKRLLNGK